MKTLAFAMLATLAVSGCDTWETSSLPQDIRTTEVPANVNPGEILVTENSMSGRSLESLGDLKVTVNKTTALHPAPTREMVIEELQENAAKLGANAVIDAKISEVEISAFSWGTRTGTGTAVRLPK